MYKIKIDGEIFFAEKGETLSRILIEHNKEAEHPCGSRGVCGKCTVLVDGKEELSCRYRIEKDIQVVIPSKSEILSETGTEETGKQTENMCFVLDIGTTTLALSLISADDGKTIRTVTRTNPQRIFGADVIARIDYCTKNGTEKLQKILLDKINEMTESFSLQKPIKMYASGNMTMLHILFGINPQKMGVSPYTPEFLSGKEKKFPELKNVSTVLSLPGISAFIGADLVAGLLYVTPPSEGKYNFLIDLGTNAEIILYSENRILCTSAAAGPCFEGAGISCGMSATDGAICSYGKGRIRTISDALPQGICGTGLVDIIAEIISDGTTDNSGFMECEELEIAENICINQNDIRQFQLAKSAVFSAIDSLMKNAGISYDCIEKVYISGGFSAEMNISNAVKVGLIPKEFEMICESINNSSLLGAVKYASEKYDLSYLTEKAEYIDLSEDEYFSDLFIKNMTF